jgi:uncharacterized protein (UPF0276 family)
MDTATFSRDAIPATIGIGLRFPHMAEILATRPALGWLEVHSENYMDGGPLTDGLLRVRHDYPVSLHGVGLSLGSAEGVDRAHLSRLASLVDRTEPMLVSEHLSWSAVGGTYLNDLLPLPYTEEALDVVTRNIEVTQAALARQILVENPSRYLNFRHSTIDEPEFLAELVRRTGCGLLCDVNNIYVSCANTGGDMYAYLDALPLRAIGEIHLAGHAAVERGGRTLLIDDHGAPVCDAVWALYRAALTRFGLAPTLVEWDKQLPELAVLLAEAQRAELAASNVFYAHAFTA